ncbi:MAG: glycosyltransferase family 9 protein [Desulfobacterium sp.]|nr:glycosyltransferase family 9 protein [Desulfobacterium sp.]MBU3949190.1 glycosyltransferase family 9 protein [Pseudomonadota bacterium]MBU4037073.1 glycosyltransferase family 9 protein [Pseudomonadota bacterium]
MQKKLLFIHQGAIGDIVSLFPAIIKLKAKFNRIDAFCNKDLGNLACLLKITNRTYPVEAAFFSSIFSDKVDPVAKEILRSYDEILLFSYSDQIEKTISGIVNKRIYRIPPRPDATIEIHILDYILKFLVKYKLTDNDSLPGKEYHDYLTKEIGNSKAQDTGSKVIIHPGSGSRRKNWPVANFIKVCKNLESKGISIDIIIGPAEYDLAEKFKSYLPSSTKIHSPAKLLDIVPLLKQSSGFIGNDSGISHLAAFMGIPAIVIFGPSDPKRWKPFGPFVKILRSQTECNPCFETGKTDCKDIKCLDGVTPEIVLNTLYFSMLKHDIAP